jgi:hypothetical protein
MEALVKLNKPSLIQKQDSQLRQILRKEFQFIQGTRQMTVDQLADKILQLQAAKEQSIANSSGINVNLVYRDTQKREWKVTKIEQSVVNIINSKGHETNVTTTSFKSGFEVMRYTTFSDDVVVEDMSDDQEESDVKQQPAIKENKSSKSNVVRSIIRSQITEYGAEKVTSGTVMEELDQKYTMKIHRSFCSTLINQVKKNG